MTISILWLIPVACVSLFFGFIVLALIVVPTPSLHRRRKKKENEIKSSPSHSEIVSQLYTFRKYDYYNYFYVLDTSSPETIKVMRRLVAELTQGRRSTYNENFTPETCKKLGKMLRELDALIICEKPYEEQYKALQAELEKCLDIEE